MFSFLSENDVDGGASFEGEYTCIATNGYTSERASAFLVVQPEICSSRFCRILLKFIYFLNYSRISKNSQS